MKDTILEVLGLKALPRTGWERKGVPAPESVAAHSWGVSWLVLVLLPPSLDLRRALTYAVLHDLPEVRAGDWTPHDLRRTGATMMQALGITPEVVDRCQNHVLKGSRVRRHYLTHPYNAEKRDAWTRLGAELEGILNACSPVASARKRPVSSAAAVVQGEAAPA